MSQKGFSPILIVIIGLILLSIPLYYVGKIIYWNITCQHGVYVNGECKGLGAIPPQQPTPQTSPSTNVNPAPNSPGQTTNPDCYLEKVICIKAPCDPVLRCDNPLPAPISSARDDLAKQLKVSATDIVVINWEEIQWSDGSLGCPEPGKFYTQAIVPGYQVTFEFNNQQYEYHTNKNSRLVTCKSK